MLDADRALFESINGLAGRSSALDNVMEMLVRDFFLPVVLSLAAFVLWFYGRSAAERYQGQWAFLYASVGVGFSNLVVTIFNSAIDRPRPFFTVDDVHVLFYRPTDPSFPSNAAAFAFALAAGVFLVRRRWGLAIGFGGVLFAFARVYAGMHFPYDVVSGALIGILTTWFFAHVLNQFRFVVDWALGFLRRFYLA